MWVQLRKRSGPVVLGAAVVVVWLGLAACGGTPAAPPAPQAPAGSVTSDAWTALSQNPRFAQATPDDTQAPAGPKVMSPAEARSAAPFVFGMPAWAPAGFQLQAQADVIAP